MNQFLEGLPWWMTSLATLFLIPLLYVLRKVWIKYLKGWGSYLFEGIFYNLGGIVNQNIAAYLSMRKYCRSRLKIDKFRYLNIPASKDITVEIDDIFVPLTLNLSNSSTQKETADYRTFLDEGKRLILIGDPGSGKSSLTKRILRDYCMQGSKSPRKTQLPYLLELKSIPFNQIGEELDSFQDYGQWLMSYIQSQIRQSNVYKMLECFNIYADTKGVIILLDGLDEVASNDYTTSQKCIVGLSHLLSERSGENRLLVTMRTQLYQQIKADFISDFPLSATLHPFSPAGVYEFLSRWKFEKDRDGNIHRIYNDLLDRPTLREMCSNPLVLSMYVAEDEFSGGVLSPECRTEFYKKITTELIIKRRFRQRTLDRQAYPFLKEQRERVLGRIAYAHLTNPIEHRNSLQWKNAIKIIEEILACDQIKAFEVFDEISRETGLITEEKQNETFQFIHLTFCEYLAANEAIQYMRDGWEGLLEFHQRFSKSGPEGNSRLIEVIPFAAGLLQPVLREDALNSVMETRDFSLISRCFLETKSYFHPRWNEYVNNSRVYFSENLASGVEEELLRNLHLFNVVIRDANLASEHFKGYHLSLPKFYENLVEKDQDKIEQILNSLAKHNGLEALRLAENCGIDLHSEYPNIIVQNCDQPPLFNYAKAMCTNGKDDGNNWAAILLESALEKRIVSCTLHSLPPSQFLSDKISTERSVKKWHFRPIIMESLLTQIISILHEKAPHGFFSKKSINTIYHRTPKEYYNSFIFNRYAIAIYILVVFMYAVTLFFVEESDSYSNIIVGRVLSTIAFICFFLTVTTLFLIKARGHIHALINLKDRASEGNSSTKKQLAIFFSTLLALLLVIEISENRMRNKNNFNSKKPES